ncbi:MAG: hypothetical protein ACP5VR_05465 [Acidimicrobiales bacterium]
MRRFAAKPTLLVTTWAASLPELVIATLALVAVALTADLVAGAGGLVAVVATFCTFGLAVAALLPRPSAPVGPPEAPVYQRTATMWFNDYWCLLTRLSDGTASLTGYKASLGPSLQHLLAARLSEHHGINLYSQPDAGRAVLCARVPVTLTYGRGWPQTGY